MLLNKGMIKLMRKLCMFVYICSYKNYHTNIICTLGATHDLYGDVTEGDLYCHSFSVANSMDSCGEVDSFFWRMGLILAQNQRKVATLTSRWYITDILLKAYIKNEERSAFF